MRLINDFFGPGLLPAAPVPWTTALVIQTGQPEEDENHRGSIGGRGPVSAISALLKTGAKWDGSCRPRAGTWPFPFVGREEAEYAEFKSYRKRAQTGPEGDSVVTGFGIAAGPPVS